MINCYDGNYGLDDLKVASSNNELSCPACGGSYEYCHGQVVQPYFRHKSKLDCDNYSESETEEHLTGKRKLFEWICKQDGVSDAVLEGYIPETKQRPDIMFNYNGKRYVLEYQCTPITDEYTYRHSLYKFAGIKDIWILGTQKYLNCTSSYGERRVKEIEKKNKMHYDPFNDVFMLMFSSYPKSYPEVSICDTIEDAIECAKVFAFSTFMDKEKILCAFSDSMTFNGSFRPSDSGVLKYNRIYRRMEEIVEDAFDKISASAKMIGIDLDIARSSTQKNKLGQVGSYSGHAFVQVNNRSPHFECKLSYTFMAGVPTWSAYIEFGNAKWWKKGMNTKIFLTYLGSNMSVTFKQMLKKI